MALDPLARQIIARYESMKNLREGNWEDTWQQIADHVLGRRDFIVSDDPGRRRDVPIYDTTGRTMVNLLAGGLLILLEPFQERTKEFHDRSGRA